jgi:glycosyltransferase involved in cell wall biosynthesis
MINFSTRPPTVSVVMPVFNAAQFITAAIESILLQTLRDFELIIVDDGSTDNSTEIIRSFTDKRIILIRQENNIGNYACRNLGMAAARGKYIAVMDADDIALPRRLERQYYWMENNPETGICGTFIQIIPSGYLPQFVTDEKLLKVAFLCNNYCSHPSLFIRKNLLTRYNLQYDEQYYYSADFDLCARGLKYFNIQNIPEVLLQYRNHPGQISVAKYKQQQYFADQIRIKQLIENLAFLPEEIPADIHLAIMHKSMIEKSLIETARNWVLTILSKNKDSGYYSGKHLSAFLGQLLNACFSNQQRKYEPKTE